jgi:nucleoside-diphosphate-sugar epimerase
MACALLRETRFPLEEDYDGDPMDSWELSWVMNEKTARAFNMRAGADIYALRIGNVIEPHENDSFPAVMAYPHLASKMPGTKSIHGTSARSYISVWKRTDWITRY